VLVTSGTDGAVLAWNVRARTVQRLIERQPSEVAPVIAISPDGKTLALPARCAVLDARCDTW
jgi:WD40 repeat protein